MTTAKHFTYSDIRDIVDGLLETLSNVADRHEGSPSSEEQDEKTEAFDAMVAFIFYFWLVFENDWECTKGSIEGISHPHTFLNPGVADESDNWANRGSLLSQYRKAASKLIACGIRIPDDVLSARRGLDQ